MRPTVLRVTLHAYEMATLIAAARWVSEGAEGDLPAEVVEQLGGVLERYESALGRSAREAGGASGS